MQLNDTLSKKRKRIIIISRNCNVLLCYAVIALVLSVIRGIGVSLFVDTFFPIISGIALYYSILFLFSSVIREHFDISRTLFLWTIPNFLYIRLLPRGTGVDHPLIYIPVGAHIVKFVFALWVAGLLAVLLHTVASHIIYKKRLLKYSDKIVDEKTLQMWASYCQAITNNPERFTKIEIRKSDILETPLTMGLFLRSTYIFLPAKEYTEQEKCFIFRHELFHILNGDIHIKLFLRICCALCWFCPFIWPASKKCAEDIELHCDLQVLDGSNNEDRRAYTELLLSIPANNPGLTSNLLSNARALEYRCTNILHPKEKKIGILLGFISSMLVIFLSGSVALIGTSGSIKEYIFSDTFEKPVFDVLELSEDRLSFYGSDEEEKVIDYISGIQISPITGAPNENDGITFFFQNRNDVVTIGEKYIIHTIFHRHSTTREYYVIESEVDRAYIMSLVYKK